ncbi:electron transfer flavoprotein subunit beta/FixA family protein [Crossiella cryophila]|uniref:Electron transfer flavoprotein subunit beta n=1 Tax=Crossiella cryophila TaxID=43355 RepID=A0A7W7CJ73_9PSEU|nr:electron transfer flavoprotein subunit beta/FixA family protein [Crossiella cryophila]MBB4682210.1 electron transfer flavoprotein beta subunit [Crossiella cryophila]
MNIVVLVKQVPDTYSERKLTEADHTLDRDSADAVLDEINERAVEEALRIQEAHGGEVTVVAMGPERTTEAIRKALSMGADKAIHLTDPALHGSCQVTTAKALAKLVSGIEGVDLVIAGNESSDGRGGAVPAMVAEVLGLPVITQASKVELDDTTVKVQRVTDEGLAFVEATLPAVISVTEKINEPRYPSFKGIMAAKKKPVSSLSLADAGIDAGEVGLAAASTKVVEAAPKPPRSGGQKIEDDGTGGTKIVEFLSAQKLV